MHKISCELRGCPSSRRSAKQSRRQSATSLHFVTQSVDDQCVFTTFERFADRVAMERHNASPALVRFLQRTKLHLDGDVVIHVGEEIASR